MAYCSPSRNNWQRKRKKKPRFTSYYLSKVHRKREFRNNLVTSITIERIMKHVSYLANKLTRTDFVIIPHSDFQSTITELKSTTRFLKISPSQNYMISYVQLLAVTCCKPKNANVSYLLRPARIHKSLIPFRICRLHGRFCSSLALHAEKRQRLVNNANTSLCDFKKSFTALFSS